MCPLSAVARGLRSRAVRAGVLVLAVTLGYASTASATPIWNVGDVVTNTQSNWADISTPAGADLGADFDTVYAPVGGGLLVGSPTPGFYMLFGDAFSVQEYLPAVGAPGPLTNNFIDPLTSPSSVFGGDVVALKLNIDFNDAGFLLGSLDVPFGNLILENFGPLSLFNGRTVRQILGADDTALGGGFSVFSIADLDNITESLNVAFENGVPSTFARDHLVAPASVTPVPEPASLLLVGTGLVATLSRFRRRRSTRNSPQ